MTIFHSSIKIFRDIWPERILDGRGAHVLDITDYIKEKVAESAVLDGFVVVQTLHTTLALIINERESGFHRDLAERLEHFAPAEHSYHHDNMSIRTENLDPNEPERDNGHSHCRASVLAPSIQIIIKDGKLVFGRWQSALVVELDGPRENRNLAVLVMGE